MSERPPKTLYKYYSAETVINHVLGAGTIKWSSPVDFNDPFDNHYEFCFEEVDDDLIDNLLDKVLSSDFSHLQFSIEDGNQKIPASEVMRLIQSIELGEEHRRFLRVGVIDLVERAKQAIPKFKDDFASVLSETNIFCLTETFSNLLMWSHYAQHHKGAVIAFSAKDDESVIPLAKKVKYVKNPPKLKYEDILRDSNDTVRPMVENYTMSKSVDWSYEQEWRVVSFGLGGIRPFPLEEVDSVYLGCRISPKSKQAIMSLCSQKLPWVEIYQATKNSTCYRLDFEKIDLNH